MEHVFINIIVGLVGVAGGVFLALMVARTQAWRLHYRAKSCGLDIPFDQVVGMSFAKVDVEALIRSRVDVHNHGLKISDDMLQRFLVSGCDIQRALRAVVAAKSMGVSMSFEQACGMLLAGKDPMSITEEVARPSLFVSEHSARHKIGETGVVHADVHATGVVRIGDRDIKAICLNGSLPVGVPVAVQGYAEEVIFVQPAFGSAAMPAPAAK